MGAFEDFLDGARRALELLTEAQGLLRSARERNGEARVRLTEAAAGSGNDRVAASLTRLESVGEALNRAEVASVGGGDTFREYLVQIGAASALSATASSTAAEPPAAVKRSPLQLQDFRPGRFHRDAVKAIEREGYPRNKSGKTTARAHLYDADGREVQPTTYKAYVKGEQPDRPELTPPFNDADRTTTAWHAESDIAQAIRDGGMREATIYLNVPLCGKSSKDNPNFPDPRRCSENLRHIIPRDVVVYVHVVPERGTESRRRIVGTGEGIKGD